MFFGFASFVAKAEAVSMNMEGTVPLGNEVAADEAATFSVMTNTGKHQELSGLLEVGSPCCQILPLKANKGCEFLCL